MKQIQPVWEPERRPVWLASGERGEESKRRAQNQVEGLMEKWELLLGLQRGGTCPNLSF